MDISEYRQIAEVEGQYVVEWQGDLHWYYETGYEGPPWSLIEDDVKSKGYDALHMLEDGDYLIVYNPGGSVHWQGLVKLQDDKPGLEEFSKHDTGWGAGKAIVAWNEMFMPHRVPRQWSWWNWPALMIMPSRRWSYQHLRAILLRRV